MLAAPTRSLHCAVSCAWVLLVTACAASWVPNESASAAAEYQNRGSAGTAYELTLGDVLPGYLLREDQSINFVNKFFRYKSMLQTGNKHASDATYCRLVGSAAWPVSPELFQALHQVAKTVCGTTRYVCRLQLSTSEGHPGQHHSSLKTHNYQWQASCLVFQPLRVPCNCRAVQGRMQFGAVPRHWQW